MYQHIVLFEIKKGTPKDNVDQMISELRGLGQYPEVADLTVGANFSQYNTCHTHGLVVRTKDRLALQEWESRPEVQKALKDYAVPICESIAVADLDSQG